MKSRHGFVSNSSSSSFIFMRSIQDVAKEMFQVVSNSYEETFEEYPGSKERWQELQNYLDKAIKRKDVISGKVGICFPSTNFSTYIFYKNRTTFVCTCNNHNWDDIEGLTYYNNSDDNKKNDPFEVMKKQFFVHVQSKNKVISKKYYVFKHEEDTKLICSCCNVNDNNSSIQWYHFDRKENKFCGNCYSKLKEIEKTEEEKNENKKEDKE